MLELFGRLLLLPVTMLAYGLEALARAVASVDGPATPADAPLPSRMDPNPRQADRPAGAALHRSTRTEEQTMGDRNLSDDMVKLVQWSLVSVKRDGERVFRDGEDLVTDNLTPDGFTAWIVRKYGGDIPLGDAAYIRVYYNVLDRWAKQDLHFESRQLAALERIADCVCADKREGAGYEAGGGGSASGGGGGRRRGGEAAAAT